MPDKIEFLQIEYGDRGIESIVDAIYRTSEEFCINWGIIALARQITKHCKPKDKIAEACALFDFVKRYIKYVEDPVISEMIQTPVVTLQEKAGDCDDMVCLLLAMNMAIGNQGILLTASEKGKSDFSHIFLAIYDRINQKFTPFDPSFEDASPGWMPDIYSDIGRLRIWYPDYSYKDVQLAGFCDEAKKLVKKIYKEMKRAERRVRKERDRFVRKLGKLMAEVEDKLGIFGKILVHGWKVGVNLFPILAVALDAYDSDSPFHMSEEEWKLFAKTAMAVASLILSIFSAGATIPLLAASIISIVNTTWSAIDMKNNIEERKKIIKQLKEQKAIVAMEERVQRESLAKLEKDILLLEKIETWVSEQLAEIERIKLTYQETIDSIRYEVENRILELRKAKDDELKKIKDSVLLSIKQELSKNIPSIILEIEGFRENLGFGLTPSEKDAIKNDLLFTINGVTI